jgi:hypothetical protein
MQRGPVRKKKDVLIEQNGIDVAKEWYKAKMRKRNT